MQPRKNLGLAPQYNAAHKNKVNPLRFAQKPVAIAFDERMGLCYSKKEETPKFLWSSPRFFVQSRQ